MPFMEEISPLTVEDEDGRGLSVVQCSPMVGPDCAGVSFGKREVVEGCWVVEDEVSSCASFSGARVAKSWSAISSERSVLGFRTRIWFWECLI